MRYRFMSCSITMGMTALISMALPQQGHAALTHYKVTGQVTEASDAFYIYPFSNVNVGDEVVIDFIADLSQAQEGGSPDHKYVDYYGMYDSYSVTVGGTKYVYQENEYSLDKDKSYDPNYPDAICYEFGNRQGDDISHSYGTWLELYYQTSGEFSAENGVTLPDGNEYLGGEIRVWSDSYKSMENPPENWLGWEDIFAEVTSFEVIALPEPSSMLLLGTTALMLLRRKKI